MSGPGGPGSLVRDGGDGLVVVLPGEQGDEVAQAADAAGLRARQQLGLGEVLQRHDDPVDAGARRGEHRRQHARHRSHPAVQAELPQQHPAQQRLRRDAALRGEHGRREGQVEGAAPLGHRRRRQREGDPPLRPRLPAVDDGGAHPVSRLGERGVRQPDHRETRQPLGEVGLDLDDVPLQTDQPHRVRPGQRHEAPPPEQTRCRWWHAGARGGPVVVDDGRDVQRRRPVRADQEGPGGTWPAQVKALIPVMSRPTISVWMSAVPS